jgi:hypothetical protein
VADDKTPEPKRAPKKSAGESKRILQNVTYPDREYGPGDEDELEQRMTPERYEQLKDKDPPVLAGEWDCCGEGDAPTPRSRAANAALQANIPRGSGPHPAAPEKPHPAVAEVERLKTENEKLKAEADKHRTEAETHKADAARHKAEAEKHKAAKGKDQ